MDGALQSSRQGGGGHYGPPGSSDRDRDRGGGYHGGGGYGGGGYGGSHRHGRHGGGGHRRYSDGGHPYRRDGGRRRGGGGRGRGGGGGGRGNRFSANRTTSVDPQTAMLRQLGAMVAKMGDLVGAADSARAVADAEALAAGGGGEMETSSSPRPVVGAVAKNASDLIAVLCAETNAPLFLKYEGSDAAASAPADATADADVAAAAPPRAEEVRAEDASGPLASLLASCAATLPTQTPSHVALTLGVDAAAPEGYGGFAARCVDMASRRIGNDIDRALGWHEGGSAEVRVDENLAGDGWDGASASPVDAYVRSKLLLRYLALLARAGVVEASGGEGEGSLSALLSSLATAAGAAAASASSSSGAAGDDDDGPSYRNASAVLASLVLSVLPYALPCLSQGAVEALLDALEPALAAHRSPFRPGIGPDALLLRGPQVEARIEDVDDDEEDDGGEGDVDDEDGGGVCCDTLQDLARTVRSVVADHYGAGAGADGSGAVSSSLAGTRFALPTDAPWADISIRTALEDGAKKGADFAGERLSVGGHSAAIRHLSALEGAPLQEGPACIHVPSLDGIVYGRLAIFGIGDDDDDDDDDDEDDDDDDDDDEGAAPASPELAAYIKGFSQLDRYFLSDTVRDCLVSNRPTVTATGAERGSTRDVAEQVLSIANLFVPPKEAQDESTSAAASASPAPGVEYGVVETILSLIVQARRREEGSDCSSSPLSHVYLSRVLLEMTKLQPTLLPRCTVAAVSALFEDFLPSLVPSARASLADWFALHLTNTDYQWPSSYWAHWTPYAMAALSGTRNSRGEFVIGTLRSMVSLTSSASQIVSHCIPPCSKLVDALLYSSLKADGLSPVLDSLGSLEKDVETRIWDHNDDPDAIREYIISDELQESGSAVNEDGAIWWRTGIVAKAVLRPVTKDFDRSKKAIKHALKSDDGDVMEEENLEEMTDDDLVDVAETVSRYKPVIFAALARDLQAHDEKMDAKGVTKSDEGDMLVMGEVHILRQIAHIASQSQAVLVACVDAFVRDGVVSPMAVFRWALGECDQPTNNIPAAEYPVLQNWFRCSAIALYAAIESGISEESEYGEMIIDRGGEGDDEENDESPVSKKANKIFKAVAPLLDYATKRVCRLLTEIEESGRNRMKPLEADLVDGMKILVATTQTSIVAALSNDKSLSVLLDGKKTNLTSAIFRQLARSNVSGVALASKCRQESSSLSKFGALVLKSLEGP